VTARESLSANADEGRRGRRFRRRLDRVSSHRILVLPGGGYEGLAEHEGEPIAQWLRGLGWDARVLEYPVRTRHPGPLSFVRDAIAHERATGATTLGLIGFSAGGHLAGHAALKSDVDFAILGYAVTTMMTPTRGRSRANLLGDDPTPQECEAVSLEHLVTASAPPIFLWHTVEDESVPVRHAYLLADALGEAGIPHDLHVFRRGAHGVGLAPDLPAGRWTSLCEEWMTDLGLTPPGE
jgi:acetyl esterase/lipase